MKAERGQALILIALGLVVMIAMTGLAVDGGNAFAEHRTAQNAADNAALAAAYNLAAGNPTAAVTAARAIADSNGYDSVTINIPPTSGQYAGNSEYVEVIISTTTQTMFAPVVGMEEINSTVSAVARGRPAQGGSLANGNAIMALSNTGKSTMLYNGGANVTVTGGSGMFVNSNDKDALFFNSNITINAPGMTVVGGYKTNATFPWLNTIKTGQTSQSIPLPPVSLTSKIPAIPTAPTCSTSGSYTNTGFNEVTYTPGNHNSIIVNSGTKAKFKPGVYCLNGHININGNGIMEGLPGSIKFVMSDAITMSGGPHTFDDIEFYSKNSDLKVQNGGDILKANRFRFYATGSGQVHVGAQAVFEANDAFFYFGTSDFTWNGQAIIKLKAPPQGDPFAGLLIYMPWSNTTDVKINGGSTVDITGTIMIPHADLTINGGADMNALNSQIIAHTTKFNGNGNIKVEFNADENFKPAEAPIVELSE
jgi:hypothetical protein